MLRPIAIVRLNTTKIFPTYLPVNLVNISAMNVQVINYNIFYNFFFSLILIGLTVCTKCRDIPANPISIPSDFSNRILVSNDCVCDGTDSPYVTPSILLSPYCTNKKDVAKA